MGLGDRADDRETQSDATASTGRIAATEAIEGVRQKLLAEAGPPVGQVYLHRAGGQPCAQRGRSGAVTYRVVDEVRDGLLDAVGIGTNRRAGGDRPGVDLERPPDPLEHR